MKKIIMLNLILFTIFLISYSVSSQVWAPMGAEWYYTYTETGSGGPTMEGYYLLIVESDTIVENKQCSVLSRHLFHANGDYELQTPPLVTYEENNIVYYLQNGQFYILYDFSAELGDSWISRNPYEFYNWPMLPGEDTLSTYTMDSINLVNINGLDLKQIWISSSTNWYFAGHVTERIGSQHFMLPGIWGVWDPPVLGNLRCYFDNNFSYSSNLPCDTIIMTIENEIISPDKLEVFPNPCEDFLLIVTQVDIAEMQILDLTGRIFHVHLESRGNRIFQVETNNLTKGFYLLKLRLKDNTIKISKIFKK